MVKYELNISVWCCVYTPYGYEGDITGRKTAPVNRAIFFSRKAAKEYRAREDILRRDKFNSGVYYGEMSANLVCYSRKKEPDGGDFMLARKYIASSEASSTDLHDKGFKEGGFRWYLREDKDSAVKIISEDEGGGAYKRFRKRVFVCPCTGVNNLTVKEAENV
jgi:hypothetical protein